MCIFPAPFDAPVSGASLVMRAAPATRTLSAGPAGPAQRTWREGRSPLLVREILGRQCRRERGGRAADLHRGADRPRSETPCRPLRRPEIEYVNPPAAVDPGTRRGRAEVRLALRRARQSSPSYRHELLELFDLGVPCSPPSAATLALQAVARSRKRRTPGPSATAKSFASNGVSIWRLPSKPPGCRTGRWIKHRP